jgi:hypothetical protein
MASQIQLTNTFNEFRQAYNEAANDITILQSSNTSIHERVEDNEIDILALQNANNSLYVLSTAEINPKSVQVADLEGTGSRIVFGSVAPSGNGAILSDDAGFIYHSGNSSVELTGALVSDSVQTQDSNVANTLSVETTLVVGQDKFTVDGSTGDIVATGNLELTFEESRIDAYHIHADWHLGAGGDVEAWAAGKGTDVDSHKVFGVGDEDAAVDMLIANQNDGLDAYAEFIAVNDTGTIDDGWCSFGINSSNYAEAAYGVTKADDGYLLYQPPANTTLSGDLVIGTGGNGTGNKIIFSANGFDDPANNTQMIIHPGEKVEVAIDTESSNTSTGALVVRGGMGLEGNLNIGGNVNIVGDITLGGSGNTVSLDSLQVEGPIVFVANNNPGDTFDIGIVGQYVDGGSIVRYTGAVRDASDGGRYKIFSNANAEFQTDIANTVIFSDPDLTFSAVQVGSVFVSDTTSSTSTTTGAITTSGGVGVAGAAYVGGIVRATNSTASTSTSTGAVVVTGGVGVAGNTHVGGELVVTGNTQLTGLTGDFTTFGNPTFAGTTTFTGPTVITGPLRVQELLEDVIDVAPSSNQYTLNYDNGNIFYSTSAPSADFQLLLTNVPTTNGRVKTFTFILPQGATARRPAGNVVNINGANTTINWVGGNDAIVPTNSKTDIFSFTILRRSNTFTVAGVQTPDTVL